MILLSALALLVAAPAVLLAVASLAGLFGIGVRAGRGDVHRGLTTGELVGVAVGGVVITGAAVLLLRRSLKRHRGTQARASVVRRELP